MRFVCKKCKAENEPRHWVDISQQLGFRYGSGKQNLRLYSAIAGGDETLEQKLPSQGLATASWPHNGDAYSILQLLTQLETFFDRALRETLRLALLLESGTQFAIAVGPLSCVNVRIGKNIFQQERKLVFVGAGHSRNYSASYALEEPARKINFRIFRFHVSLCVRYNSQGHFVELGTDVLGGHVTKYRLECPQAPVVLGLLG